MAKRRDHPGRRFLNFDKMPSVWCSGCGIGIVVNTFVQALQKISIPGEKIQLVSTGLGCTGKISGYVKLNSIQSAGQDPFLTALNGPGKNQDTKTIIFFQDSDILVHGLEGLKQACRSGENLMGVYVNGFIFHTLSLHKKSPGFSSSGLFNLPYFAFRSGASVIARWTPLHCRRLSSSLRAGLLNPGFSFLEVISPCLMYYASADNQTKTLDRMALFLNNACINHCVSWEDLEVRDIRKFSVGHFLEKNNS